MRKRKKTTRDIREIPAPPSFCHRVEVFVEPDNSKTACKVMKLLQSYVLKENRYAKGIDRMAIASTVKENSNL